MKNSKKSTVKTVAKYLVAAAAGVVTFKFAQNGNLGAKAQEIANNVLAYKFNNK